MTQWFRGAAPDGGRRAHSAICRSRCNGLRYLMLCWFRGFVSDGKYPAIRHPAVPALALTEYSRPRFVVGPLARSANTKESDDGVVRFTTMTCARPRATERGPPRPPRNPSLRSCAAPVPANGRDRTITARAARDKTTKPPRRAASWRSAPRTADGRMGTAPAIGGRTTKPLGHAVAMSFKPVRHASQHSGPYDETTEAHKPYCSAPGRVGFLLVSLLCRSKEE